MEFTHKLIIRRDHGGSYTTQIPKFNTWLSEYTMLFHSWLHIVSLHINLTNSIKTDRLLWPKTSCYSSSSFDNIVLFHWNISLLLFHLQVPVLKGKNGANVKGFATIAKYIAKSVEKGQLLGKHYFWKKQFLSVCAHFSYLYFHIIVNRELRLQNLLSIFHMYIEDKIIHFNCFAINDWHTNWLYIHLKKCIIIHK